MDLSRYELPDRGALFVVSGPSGAGKSTLIHAAVARFPFLGFSVSATTRPRREGEVDGVHYHYLDDAAFVARAARGDFLEHAAVYGRRYGTLREPVVQAMAAGRSMVLDIDVQGAAQIREALPEAVHVFVLPPDRDTVLARLRGRGTEDGEAVARRMREMDEQVAALAAYDYVLVNDDLSVAQATLDAIVLAELSRRVRRERLVGRWLDSLPAAAT